MKDGVLMAKLKKVSHKEDTLYPIPADLKLNIVSTNIDDNPKVQRQIIRQAIAAAYPAKEIPESQYDQITKCFYDLEPVPLATDDQIQLVISIMQALQPTDTIEAILAAQFAISHIHGMEQLKKDYKKEEAFENFAFGHNVLAVFQKYRTRGAQQIQVQYNLNQGKIVNIKTDQEGSRAQQENE